MMRWSSATKQVEEIDQWLKITDYADELIIRLARNQGDAKKTLDLN